MASVLDQLKKEIKAQQEAQSGELEDLEIESINIGQFDTPMANLFQQHQQLVSLALIDCNLKTLDGFPKLNNLENLILEGNKLDGQAVNYIAKNMKKIACLSLAENQIKTFEELEPLKQLKTLQQLDLGENPVSKLPGYFQKVFELIQSLQILDNKNKDGEEVQYTSDGEDEDLEDFDGKEIDDDDEDFDEDGDDDDEEEESDAKPVKKTKK